MPLVRSTNKRRPAQLVVILVDDNVAGHQGSVRGSVDFDAIAGDAAVVVGGQDDVAIEVGLAF